MRRSARWKEHFALLAGTAKKIFQSDDPQAVIDRACRKVAAYLGCHAFFNFLIDNKTGKLRLNACAGVTPAETARLRRLDHAATICGAAVRTGRPVVLDRAAAARDPRAAFVKSCGISAYASLPLTGRDGNAVGTLAFGARDRAAFDGEELTLMKAFADQVAAAMSRLRDEENLREMRDRFRSVLENSLEVSYRRDLRSDTYDYLSPAIENITGYGVEKFKNLDVAEVLRLVHPDDIPGVKAALETMATPDCRSAVLEYRFKGKDGAYRWISDSITVLFEDGVPRYRVGVVRDVSDRKKAEAELRESEERFHAMADNISQFAWMADAGGSVFWYNKRWYDYTGTEPEDVRGWDWRKVHHPRHVERVVEKFRRCFKAGEHWEDTFPLRGKDGTYRWFLSRAVPIRDNRGRVACWFGTNTDITGLREAERALQRSEKKYRDLLETANSIILRWTPDGIIRYINDYGLRFFGYRQEEMAGKSVRMLIPDQDSITGADLTRLAENVARNPEAYRHGENENITKDGTRRWVMWTNKAIRNDRGEIDEILAIGNDITEIKQAEKVLKRDKESLERLVDARTGELLQAHAALMRAERMSDIGRLAATVAHEIRNPLAAIGAAAYNIRRKADNPLLDRHLDTIRKKVLESDHIIQNLLGFARVKSVHIEKLNIRELLRDCILTVSAKYANWDVKLKVQIDCGGADAIEADQVQLKMLLTNMLDNAYQSLPEKSGTITVTAARWKNDAWRISIADTGTGIGEEEKEKIFDPFYTTKSRGTGLGLTVCREIVDMHGGRIEMESAKGRGTAFTVTLPARRAGHPVWQADRATGTAVFA